MPDKRTAEQHKMAMMTKGLGLGRGAHNMVQSQRTRDSKNRGHGDLTLDQAYDITAELLIRQRGLCWVTGSELVINGCSDNLRSYSIDRLDDSRGYSVDNCRAVCIWVNTASAYSGHSKTQLWRHLSKVGPIETPNTDPNYQYLFTCDWYLARVIQEGVACGQRVNKATIDRAAKWSRLYDFPPIAPISALTDDQVMGLIAG